MEHVIYKLTSPSGKIYIGRTHNFDTRMNGHKYNAFTKKAKNSLYKAIRKYGWENFRKEIIANVPSEELAQTLEEALIKQFDSVKNGYNDTYMGGGGDLWKNKPENQKQIFRKKMSRITTGQKNGMYGKKQSEEARKLQKEKAKGRFSLEWYIQRHGIEEGTKLYKERSYRLSKRTFLRNERGIFVSLNG